MTPLKFRAWHKNTGKMIDLHKITPFAAGDLPGVFVPYDDALLVMQSTGLKDTNGIEAFEDDIVEDFAGNRWPIRWNQNECCFIGTEWQAGPPTIIGNLHQNPELLPSK